jgi:arginine decarboxylase
MCLVGAYQDALGDYHNLFGETNEAFIDVNEDGTWSLGRITAGSQVADMLEWVRYDPKDLKRRIRRRVERLRQNGRLGAEEARALAARYVALIDSSTYLESRR